MNIDALIDRLETANGINYAPMQREAIALAAKNRMLVITGDITQIDLPEDKVSRSFIA